MRSTRILSTLALLGSISTPALAEDHHEGFYAFLGVSMTNGALGNRSQSSSTSTTFTSSHISSTRQKGAGIQGGIGYQFTKNSAIEVIALRLPKTTETWNNTSTDIPSNTVSTSSSTRDISNTSLAITWVHGVPINQVLNPFARAGVTLSYSKSKDTNTNSGGSTGSGSSTGFSTGYLLGLGNDFYFTPERRTALRTELMLQSNGATFNSGSASLATSLVFKF